MADGEVLALSQDMTIARDAFLRSLPAAVDHVAFRVDGREIHPLDPHQRWRIALEPMDDLILGMIVLPRQHVEIFLTDCNADEAQQFLARFELYFRRAGG